MGWKVADLGGGYRRIDGAVYALYVAVTLPVSRDMISAMRSARSTYLRSARLSIKSGTLPRGRCGGLVSKNDVAFVGSELVNMAFHLLVQRLTPRIP